MKKELILHEERNNPQWSIHNQRLSMGWAMWRIPVFKFKIAIWQFEMVQAAPSGA